MPVVSSAALATSLMMSPRISVLMACYNGERFIGAALQSLLCQTYQDFEVVVVDDGSSDASSAIVERFTGQKVQLIRQSNRGAAQARNEAFRRSAGEYVIYLDADDVVGPTHLKALLQRAEEAEGCIALSRWARFRSDISEAEFPARPTERDLAGPDWLELDWQSARPMTQSGMLLLPRALVESEGGWDERLTLSDDFEFFARQISRSKGIRFAPDARLYYRSAVAGSLSGRKSRTAVESAFLSLDLGIGHLLSKKNTPETRMACANLMKDFDYNYFPKHADLRARARKRVADLGGSTLAPDGPPGFQKLRPWMGWQAARIVQKAAERLRLNRAAAQGQADRNAARPNAPSPSREGNGP